MVIGIVGAERNKFTLRTEAQARHWIRQLCARAAMIVSGHSPLGGVDFFAIEEAEAKGIDWHEYAPRELTWGGDFGYRARNLAIAKASDLVVCITVKALPEGYTGMRFPQGCYHCAKHNIDPHSHVKSGGCYTLWEARRMGKRGELLIAK